jgi:hypothetical protein
MFSSRFIYLCVFGLCKKKKKITHTSYIYKEELREKREREKEKNREYYSNETPLIETRMNVCQQL